MKKIMVLGASELQIPIIKKAKDMGHFVLAVDMNPLAPGFYYADEKIIASTLDYDKVFKAAKENQINSILTAASDQPMNIVAKVSEKLNLNSISRDTALKTTNKYLMRDQLANANIPVPKYFKVQSYEEFLTALTNINRSAISKPADSSGSRGVLYCDNNTENLREIYKLSMENSKSKTIIVEEFMDGIEVSVESFTVNNITEIIAITDKITTGKPHFVELSHTQPSVLEPNVLEEIKEITKKTIKTLGITNGPSHTEVMVTNDGAKIIEIGARLGGDNITSHLVPLSTGVDMLAATIDNSLGIYPNLEKKYNRFSQIRFIQADTGIINKINNLDKAQKVENIIEIKMFKKEGDRSSKITSSNNRLGYVIAASDTFEKTKLAIEDALKLITMEVINE